MNKIRNVMNCLEQEKFNSVIWKRGAEYYSEGRVRNIILVKDVIRAECVGNSNYKLKINIKTQEISCTCPYMGHCKHLAALVLYSQKNDIFKIEELEDLLNEKTKSQLVELLKKMFTVKPELINEVLNVNAKETERLIKQLWLKRCDEIDLFYDKASIIIKQLSLLKENQLNFAFLLKLNDVLDRTDDEVSEDIIYELVEEFVENVELNKTQKMKLKNIFKDKDVFEELFI